jgi:hypothetical protein
MSSCIKALIPPVTAGRGNLSPKNEIPLTLESKGRGPLARFARHSAQPERNGPPTSRRAPPFTPFHELARSQLELAQESLNFRKSSDVKQEERCPNWLTEDIGAKMQAR